MTMNRGEIIEDCLNYCSAKGTAINLEGYYRETHGSVRMLERELHLMEQSLIDEDLISTTDPNKIFYRITPKGQHVVDNGGWQKHIEKRKENEVRTAEETQLQMNLAKSNIEANRINRINQKRNLYVLIIGLIMTATGVAISVINLIDKGSN